VALLHAVFPHQSSVPSLNYILRLHYSPTTASFAQLWSNHGILVGLAPIDPPGPLISQAQWEESFRLISRRSHSPDDEPTFHKYVESLPSGRSYFLELAGNEDFQRFCPNLLKVFMAQTNTGYDDPMLLQNNEEMGKGGDRLRAWLTNNILPDVEDMQSLLDQAWTSYMQNTDQDVYSYFLSVKTTSLLIEVPVIDLAKQRMHRKDVSVVHGPIANSAVMKLRWREQDQDAMSDPHEVTISLPPDTMSQNNDDKRYIAFLPGGFNIYDQNGEALGITNGQTYTMSNSVLELRLRNSDERSAFMRLCRGEAALPPSEADDEQDNATSHPPPPLPTYPAAAFSGRSISLYDIGTLQAQIEKSRQTYDIVQTGDAMYLIEVFLREYYPGGGAVSAANRTACPGKPSVWLQLKDFDWEVHRNHPRYREVKDWIASGNMKPLNPWKNKPGKVLGAVLRFLRPDKFVSTGKKYYAEVPRAPGPGKTNNITMNYTEFTISPDAPENFITRKQLPE